MRVSEVKIRLAAEEDADKLVELAIRQKRLNEEFDPLLKVSPTVADSVVKYIRDALSNERSLIVVAESEGKIVGILKADLVDRIFYDPPIEGILRDFYILPEYRRKGIGMRMIEETVKLLKERGAGLITAEFPSQHKIAVEFYQKLGFRPLISIYAKET